MMTSPSAGDLIFADVVAVIAAPHLDDDHDLAKLALDLHVTKPDDIVGEKRDGVGTEGNSVKDSVVSTVLKMVTPAPVKAPIMR